MMGSWVRVPQAAPPSAGGDGILRRGDGEAGPKMFVESGLVVKSGRGRARGDRSSPLQQAARRIEPDLGEQRIRGESELALEEADELERAHIERLGDVAELQRFAQA